MRRGKRYKKNKNNFATIIFLIMFIFSGMQILKYIKDGKQNKQIFEEISEYIAVENLEEGEIKKESIVDFNTLKEKNLDTIGYLKVNGTDIESVVVQSKDNSYYLTHNFKKDNNKAGWIFADYKNKLDGTDKNIVIYGHNMKDGSMFASLKKVLSSEWQQIEQNRYINFITEKEVATYEIFSVYQIENEDYYITTDFNDDVSFQKFIDNVEYRSKKDFNVNVTSKDQLLTLSTCADNNKYRVVVHSKKIL